MMEMGRVLRDLQGRAPIPHRMVRGHDALVLHTQASGEGRLAHAMQAGPGSVAHPLTRLLCWGRICSVRYRLAAARAVSPARAR